VFVTCLAFKSLVCILFNHHTINKCNSFPVTNNCVLALLSNVMPQDKSSMTTETRRKKRKKKKKKIEQSSPYSLSPASSTLCGWVMNHFSSSTTHSPIHRELTQGLASCQNHSATADAKPTISSGGSPFAAALLKAMHGVLFLARLCFVERFQRSNVAHCHGLHLRVCD